MKKQSSKKWRAQSLYCCSNVNRGIQEIPAAVQVWHGIAVRRRRDKLAGPCRELRRAGEICRGGLHRCRGPPHMRCHVLLAARATNENQHAYTALASHHCSGWFFVLLQQYPKKTLILWTKYLIRSKILQTKCKRAYAQCVTVQLYTCTLSSYRSCW